MKNILFFCIVSLIALSSCGAPVSTPVSTGSTDTPKQTQTPKKQEKPKFETSQKETPATDYCQKNGGTVSFETKKEGQFEMEMVYCTVGGEKIDAWQYMNQKTTATGETESGMTAQ